MRYLVTGGCGFIGSHLVDRLIGDGHDVRVLDDLSSGRLENLNARAELVQGCITDAKAVERATDGVDGVFHLAAIASVPRSVTEWTLTHRTNLSGTVALLDACRPNKTPFIYASSAAVYGDNCSMPLGETDQARPLTAYGADKLGCEQHARVAGVIHGIPTFGLRFFNVYGPRQDPKSPYSGVISIFADRVRQGDAIQVHGDGGQVRDFVEVADVVTCLRLAMDRASTAARVVNVCTGRPTRIRELAELVMLASGRQVPIRFTEPRAGDISASIGNPERCRSLLGYAPATTVGVGLMRLIAEKGQPAEEAA